MVSNKKLPLPAESFKSSETAMNTETESTNEGSFFIKLIINI